MPPVHVHRAHYAKHIKSRGTVEADCSCNWAITSTVPKNASKAQVDQLIRSANSNLDFHLRNKAVA